MQIILEFLLNISGIEETGGEKDPFFNSEIAFYNSLTSATIEGDGVVDGEASVVTTSSSSSSSTTNTTGIDQITVSTQSGANAALASISRGLFFYIGNTWISV